MALTNEYHIDAEPDVGNKVNRHIIFYFVLLGVLLFATIGGLTIMYRFQVDFEKRQKVGLVDTKESIEQLRLSKRFLSGRKALFPNKKNVPIERAMEKFLRDMRKGY